MLNPVYRGDPEPERTFRLLIRFQATGHLPGSPHSFLVLDTKEEPTEAYIVMVDNDIIGIANDKAYNIKDYAVFDPDAMNIRIIRLEIVVSQFEFKPMLF